MRLSASSPVMRLCRRSISASVILRRAHSFERPAPSAALATGSCTIQGRSPIMPADFERAGERADLGGDHHGLAAIEIGQRRGRRIERAAGVVAR